MSEHPGLLGFISEAVEIGNELGVSADEAFRIQRKRNAERLLTIRQFAEPAPTNVIQFRSRAR